MTLREGIALAGFGMGFVLAVVAGVGFGGWPAGCAVAAVLLIGASLLLGYGDAEPPLEAPAAEDEDWRVYEINGVDDAGQPATIAHPMPPHAASGDRARR